MNACFALVPQFDALILAVLFGLAGGIYLFLRGLLLRARARRMPAGVPSTIPSASPGFIEVSGFASGPYTLAAPISGRPCYFHRTTVWQRVEKGQWTKVAEDTAHLPFFLDENATQVLVNPAGADIDLPCDLSEEYGAAPFSNSPDGIRSEVTDFLAHAGLNPSGLFRIEQSCIQPKTFLFIMGALEPNDRGMRPRPAENGYNLPPPARGSAPRPIMMPPAEVIRLSESTSNEYPQAMSQQARIAAALSRAGIRSANWEPVPSISEAPAAARLPEIAANGTNRSGRHDPEAASPAPPFVLGKGNADSAFLISWRSRYQAVRSCARRAAAMIWGGAALLILAMYALLVSWTQL